MVYGFFFKVHMRYMESNLVLEHAVLYCYLNLLMIGEKIADFTETSVHRHCNYFLQCSMIFSE
jgi:hypothetical protein